MLGGGWQTLLARGEDPELRLRLGLTGWRAALPQGSPPPQPSQGIFSTPSCSSAKREGKTCHGDPGVTRV